MSIFRLTRILSRKFRKFILSSKPFCSSLHKEVDTRTQPNQRFHAGQMHVSVWKNTKEVNGEERDMYSVNLQKRYKDKDGEWKDSSSLNLRDIPDAKLVLQKAFEECRLREAEVTAK